MGRFRKMSKQEENHWKRTRDKVRAIRDIAKQKEEEDNKPNGIPYYLDGKKQQVETNPIYNNGRLLVNRWGQNRKYLDWEVADLQSSPFGQLVGFNDWRNTQ